MSDQVDELLREIETLRDALQGRTVSCSMCNYTAKQRDELCEAVRAFAEQERKFAAKAFVSTTTTYGDERPRSWRKAFLDMCRLVNQ